jgi:purine-binding chemotaxis protein CheW
MLLQAAGRRVALLASHAREVSAATAAIRLPGAPPVVSGVVTVRGALVPLLDLGRLLGEVAGHRSGWHVLVELDGRRLMLAVDTMPTLAPADAEPLPHDAPTGVVQQQVSVNGETVALLDTSALADVILLP